MKTKTKIKPQTTEDRLTAVEVDTKFIKTEISTIKNNHLTHIEKDMNNMDKKIDKVDMRLWAILMILVASVFIPFVAKLWQ